MRCAESRQKTRRGFMWWLVMQRPVKPLIISHQDPDAGHGGVRQKRAGGEGTRSMGAQLVSPQGMAETPGQTKVTDRHQGPACRVCGGIGLPLTAGIVTTWPHPHGPRRSRCTWHHAVPVLQLLRQRIALPSGPGQSEPCSAEEGGRETRAGGEGGKDEKIERHPLSPARGRSGRVA